MKQTTLCYLEREGKYLMLHRTKKENDASHDKWIGVGGKCEMNESPEECMIREVKEETGFDIIDWEYRGIVTFISDHWPAEYMHLFTSSKWSGDMIDCDEGVLEWVDKEEVYNLTLWKGDRIFLKLLEDKFHPFFSLKVVYKEDELILAKLNNKILPIDLCWKVI